MERHELRLERESSHSALICTILANINRDPKKSRPFAIADFMPAHTHRVAPRKQNPEEILSIVKQWQSLYDASG